MLTERTPGDSAQPRRRNPNRHRWPSRPGCVCDSWPGRAKLEISYISRPAAASRSMVASYMRRSSSSSSGWTGRSGAGSTARSPSRRPARSTKGATGPRQRAISRSARQSSRVEPGTPKIRSSDQRGKRGRTISHGLLHLAAAVMALEHTQQLGLKRLGAQADAIDAGRGKDVGFFDVERAGIGLDGPFSLRPRDEPSFDDRRQPRKLASIQACRRTAADEDRIDLLRFRQRPLDFALEGGRDTGRRGGRHRPARRSRSNRICARRKERERRPRAAIASLAKRCVSRQPESRHRLDVTFRQRTTDQGKILNNLRRNRHHRHHHRRGNCPRRHGSRRHLRLRPRCLHRRESAAALH